MESFRTLWPYLRPYRWYMLIVIFASGGITAMNLVNPWLVRELVQIIRTEKGDAASTGAREVQDFKTSANQQCIGKAMDGPLTARLCAAEKRRESGSGHLWPKSVLFEGRTRPEFTDLPRFPSIAG